MNPRIKCLSTLVANQIAAGEVIERPASVVKELLENALDAQATQITVTIDYGGLNEIAIHDNGVGIVPEDLLLAVTPHATSKIEYLQDLQAIQSRGFRGEALASIASVSRFSIISRPNHLPYATKLDLEGANQHTEIAARSVGTTVLVRDLFFNTPVRKKFLKSFQAEFKAIELVVKRFALSAPDLAITLKHQDKDILKLKAADSELGVLNRIMKVLGKSFVENSLLVDASYAGMRLRGYLSNASYQRSQTDKQWIYINQRMVKDKLILNAIKKAYESILYPGRHFSCLLYFTMDGEALDVNVHPMKEEVRFEQPRLVHDFIFSEVRRVLPSEPVLPAVQKPMEVPALQPQGLKPAAWIPLNAQFVFLFLEGQPLVVDVLTLQKERLSQLIRQMPRPLEQRALGVPLCFSVNASEKKALMKHSEALLQCGLLFDVIGEHEVILRRLPCVLPWLNPAQLIQGLAHIENIQLENHVVDCMTMDAHHLTEEEKTEFLDFLKQTVQTSAKPQGYFSLTHAQCVALSHG